MSDKSKTISVHQCACVERWRKGEQEKRGGMESCREEQKGRRVGKREEREGEYRQERDEGGKEVSGSGRGRRVGNREEREGKERAWKRRRMENLTGQLLHYNSPS